MGGGGPIRAGNVVGGMGFTRGQLELCRGAEVPDLVGPGLRLLFVGINPGLWTAMTGWHFAHPSNRFYPALVEAGLIDREPLIDPQAPSVPLPTGAPGRGIATESVSVAPSPISLGIERSVHRDAHDRQRLVERGIGITNLVSRATARAGELGTGELREGAERLGSFVVAHRPRVVAIAGITAFRTAFGRRRASMGRQDEQIAGVDTWVVPNPSGLNAHETVDTLAGWYRAVGVAAGLIDG